MGTTVSCDLERLYGPIARRLPDSAGDECTLFAADFPRPPQTLTTHQLYILKGLHDYHPGNFRADVIYILASKRAVRYLGLCIMSVVFHEEPGEIHIELTHPATAIKRLIVEAPYKGPDDLSTGYNTRPYAFAYWPSPTERYPWPDATPTSVLPCFYLTNADDCVGTEQDRAQRDTVRGLGGDAGSMLLAELLLNASLPDNPVVEYDLEGDGGVRGVGHLSTEVKFWLPGSVGWDRAQWPDE